MSFPLFRIICINFPQTHIYHLSKVSCRHALPKNNLIMGRSRCYCAGGLSFHLSLNLSPPIWRFSGISEPLRQLTFTSRNCQWYDVVAGTCVRFLLRWAATDNYEPCTESGPIKFLTTICFRDYVIAHVSNYVNLHFTINPTWPPRHLSKSAHSCIATSSHRARARLVMSCWCHSQKGTKIPFFTYFHANSLFYAFLLDNCCTPLHVVLRRLSANCKIQSLSCCCYKFINFWQPRPH